MTLYVEVLLTALVAFAVVLLELVTSKYPRTLFLVFRSPYLYAYGAIYGLIAALIYWLLPDVAAASVGVANPWARALAVGFTVKALLHIRLFSVSVGPEKTFPVGIESIVQLFEPWLLTSIDLDEFANRTRFLSDRATKYPDPTKARDAAIAQIPPSFANDQKAAMRADLQSAQTTQNVLSVYLSYTGRRTFDATFPS